MFGKRAVDLLREVVNVLPEHLPAYNVSARPPLTSATTMPHQHFSDFLIIQLWEQFDAMRLPVKDSNLSFAVAN